MKSLPLLQILLNSLISREESIFHIKIIQTDYISEKEVNLISIVVKQGEIRRQEVDNSLKDAPQKAIKKLLRKFIKIQNYYQTKFRSYFPNSQQHKLQTDETQPSQRLLVETLNSTLQLLQSTIAKQKAQLFLELQNLQNGKSLGYEKSVKNDKFFNEPLLRGSQGLRYLNELHSKYFFILSLDKRKWIDILSLDDQIKLKIQSGTIYYGFRNYLGSMRMIKEKKEEQQQGFLPIECTQEIILFRYQKILQELQELNVKIGKSITKYYDAYSKYIDKGRLVKTEHMKLINQNKCIVKQSSSPVFKQMKSFEIINLQKQVKQYASQDFRQNAKYSRSNLIRGPYYSPNQAEVEEVYQQGYGQRKKSTLSKTILSLKSVENKSNEEKKQRSQITQLLQQLRQPQTLPIESIMSVQYHPRFAMNIQQIGFQNLFTQGNYAQASKPNNYISRKNKRFNIKYSGKYNILSVEGRQTANRAMESERILRDKRY